MVDERLAAHLLKPYIRQSQQGSVNGRCRLQWQILTDSSSVHAGPGPDPVVADCVKLIGSAGR
jgi:hypothetical protein